MDNPPPLRRQQSAVVAALAVVNAMAWTWIVWAGARLVGVTVTQHAYVAISFVAASVVPVAILAGRNLATAGSPARDSQPSDEQLPV